MRSFVRRLGSVVGLALVLMMMSTVGFAQHAAKGDNSANGQQAAVDKQTGKLRAPTAEEAKQLTEGLVPLLNDSAEGLSVVHHDNGAVSIDLQDRFQSVALAKIGADGKVEQGCVKSVAEAEEFLTGDSKSAEKPAPPLEEK